MLKTIIMQNRPIAAVKVLRVVTSSPLTAAVVCEDDKLYHLRLNARRDRPRQFANAWLSWFTGTAVGLPLSANRIIRLSKTVVRELSEVEQEKLDLEIDESWLSDCVVDPQSGPLRPFSFMPQCLVREVNNRRAFLGMYLFDIWAQRSATRKVVFNRCSTESIRAMFINDGDCFSVHATNRSPNNAYICNQTRFLYQGLWTPSAVSSWIADFRKAIPSALDRSLSSLPAMWSLDDGSAMIESLTERLTSLPDIIAAYQLHDAGLSNEANNPRGSTGRPFPSCT